ncbi:MAG: hypothetical protein JXL81_04585 [Deltaproteobacteria bacterium]|nr:hypothetical protein [Deltaproteobacteria bacterium]
MAEEYYNVVFKGQLSGIYPIDQVKKNIAKSYKLGNKKVESLFSGKKWKIKKGVNLDTAQKYSKIFEKAGAIVVLEKVGKIYSDTLVLEHNSYKDTLLQYESKVICPKCGLEQAESKTCTGCGIEISKHLDQQQETREAESDIAETFSSIQIIHSEEKSGCSWVRKKRASKGSSLRSRNGSNISNMARRGYLLSSNTFHWPCQASKRNFYRKYKRLTINKKGISQQA